jgi:hypothetical protein
MEPTPSQARRPINPAALQAHLAKRKLKVAKLLPAGEEAVTILRSDFVPIIRAEVGSEVPVNVYRYRILVPVAQTTWATASELRRVTIATTEDLHLLMRLLADHFGGLTGSVFDPPAIRGIGARDPQMAMETLEENEHVAFEVYAAPIHESDEYFRALRQELQEALGEGVILIERQQVTLL